jgi:hypothetical protein
LVVIRLDFNGRKFSFHAVRHFALDILIRLAICLRS